MARNLVTGIFIGWLAKTKNTLTQNGLRAPEKEVLFTSPESVRIFLQENHTTIKYFSRFLRSDGRVEIQQGWDLKDVTGNVAYKNKDGRWVLGDPPQDVSKVAEA